MTSIIYETPDGKETATAEDYNKIDYNHETNRWKLEQDDKVVEIPQSRVYSIIKYEQEDPKIKDSFGV